MGIHDALHDRPTEAGARHARGDGAGGTEVRVEDLPVGVSGRPDPVIVDLDDAVGAVDDQTDLDPTAVLTEVHRVGDQVPDHLGEPSGVADDPQRAEPAGNQRHPRVGSHLAEVGHHLPDHRSDVGRHRVDAEAPATEHRQGEQVLDQRQLAFRVAAYDGEQPGGLLADGRLAHVDQDLGVAQDRGQRCAELVGDGGDQLVAHALRGLLHRDPLRHVSQRGAAEHGLRRHQPGQGDLDGDRAAVSAYRARGEARDLAVLRHQVGATERTGEQVVGGAAEELVTGDAEHRLRPGVHQPDDAGSVHHDQGVGSGVDHPAEQLGTVRERGEGRHARRLGTPSASLTHFCHIVTNAWLLRYRAVGDPDGDPGWHPRATGA